MTTDRFGLTQVLEEKFIAFRRAHGKALSYDYATISDPPVGLYYKDGKLVARVVYYDCRPGGQNQHFILE